MNPTERLGKLLHHGERRGADPLAVQSGVFSTLCDDANRVLFGPLHYESGYAYPLIVWLHGPGLNEGQLLRIMPVVSVRNYVGVAPRGFPVRVGRSGSPAYDWPQTPQHILETQRRVQGAIAEARRKYHIAADRIFVAGFGSGGTMAFRLAAMDPGQFAGVLSLCGPFPRGYTPLCRLTELRRLPVFLTVGRDAVLYTPSQACDDLQLFHTAGISVTLRQYPCGDELAPQMLRDMDRWIIELITGAGNFRADDSDWSRSSDGRGEGCL